MKNLFRSAALAGAVLLSSAAVNAQALTVLGGHTTVTFAPSFFNAVAPYAVFSDLNGVPSQTASITLSITTGMLQQSTAAGEVDHSGGFIATSPGYVTRVQDFIIDSSNPQAPTISAIMTVNGTVMARTVIFNVVANSDFRLPLTPVNGIVTESGLTINVTPAAAPTLNQVFGGSQLQPNSPVGSLVISGVI